MRPLHLELTAFGPYERTQPIDFAALGGSDLFLIHGPTGAGKSYLACALAHKACRDGHRTVYFYAPKLFREIQAGQADGSLPALLKKLAKVNLLVIDDFGLEKAPAALYRDFLEILDDRHLTGSTLITSQFPPSRWHPR